MTDPATVTVPKALLAEVLNTAMSDSYSTEAEFACSVIDGDGEPYEIQRKNIRELMTIAGIEDEEEVGQGFFGLALALKEQS